MQADRAGICLQTQTPPSPSLSNGYKHTPLRHVASADAQTPRGWAGLLSGSRAGHMAAVIKHRRRQFSKVTGTRPCPAVPARRLRFSVGVDSLKGEAKRKALFPLISSFQNVFP